MSDEFKPIKHCQCKPGEPKEYCQLRERMCKVEDIRSETKLINNEFKKAFPTDEYAKTGLTGGVESSIEAAKKEIMKKTLYKEVRKINELITVQEEILTPEIESQMDFQKLIAEVQKSYAHHEDGTFEEILEKARNLKPYRGNGGIEVKKDKLVLRHSVSVGDSSYNKGEPGMLYDVAPNVIAFGRLTDVILNDTKPSKSDTRLGNQVSDQFKNDFWNEREVGDTNIKAIKFYKNGKLEIRFRKPEDAEKMRKVLKFL